MPTQLHPAAALAGPGTTGPGGFHFAESRMAGVLGRPVALIDPERRPAAIAGGLLAAAEHLDCDLLVLLDVGGDVLAHGGRARAREPARRRAAARGGAAHRRRRAAHRRRRLRRRAATAS